MVNDPLHEALARALDEGPWLHGTWPESARSIGQDALRSLRTSILAGADGRVAIDGLARAIGIGPHARRDATSEIAACATVAFIVRALARESAQALHHDRDTAVALLTLATDLAAASERLAVDTARAPNGINASRWITAAQDALERAHERTGHARDIPGLVPAVIHQLRYATSMLHGPAASIAQLSRGALVRAERIECVERMSPWSRASDDERAVIRVLSLAEAGAALALAAVDPTHGEQCARWLARTGCAVCATSVEWHTGPGSVGAVGVAKNSMNDGGRTMTTKKNAMLETLEHDASDAAWRTAGSQLLKLTREPLIAALSRHLGPDDPALRARLAAFLETELGAALLSSALSLALSAMPRSAGEVPQRLSRELRIRAIAQAGDLVAEIVTGPLRQVIGTSLQGIALSVAPEEVPANAPLPPATLTPGSLDSSAMRVETSSKSDLRVPRVA